MILDIKDKETQERMLGLWQNINKLYRLNRIQEARAKITKGKAEIAKELFWKEVEKLFPEARDTDGWVYDPIEHKIKLES